jgi:hypothetical protein
VTDAHFARPQLAEIYDLVEEERNDLDHYLAIAAEFGARSLRTRRGPAPACRATGMSAGP